MNSKTKTLTLNLALLILMLSIISCNNDEDPIPCDEESFVSLEYDPLKHIYGTSVAIGGEQWEIIIDPILGQFDTIPGTKRLTGGLSYPIGTTRLFSFENNQRIFIGDQNNELIIQDLTTSDYTTIDLKDATTSQSIIFPQFIIFGNTENQLFILDTDKSLWEVDIQNNLVEKIIEKMVAANNVYISDILYVKGSDDFILTTTMSAINDPISRELMLYDNDIDSIINVKPIEGSFGFTQFPNEDTFYFLQTPTTQEGFRLMELKIVGEQFQITPKSTSDLAIDNLSGYLQTIHSATNSYICRGGSNSLETPTNFLYNIDLTTGELVNESTLTDANILLNLSSE